ncbi:MAG: hypothetical protein IPI24_07310 [Ignavibacteria bacterium]|nr:hypothetical protein [Ignavibacteria bacterium]
MKSAVCLASVLVLAAIIIGGCSETSNAPDDANDHDVITTVTFTLRPTNVVGDILVYVGGHRRGRGAITLIVSIP